MLLVTPPHPTPATGKGCSVTKGVASGRLRTTDLRGARRKHEQIKGEQTSRQNGSQESGAQFCHLYKLVNVLYALVPHEYSHDVGQTQV